MTPDELRELLRQARVDVDPESYVRKVLVNTYATWWRRRWNDERPTGRMPELPYDDVDSTVRQDVWAAPPGVPGLETWLPLLLDATAAGRLSLPQLARWCAEAPARRFGLGDRKGALRVGADADFVLVDLAAAAIVSHDGLYTKAAYTPFHGRRVRGAVRDGRERVPDGTSEHRTARDHQQAVEVLQYSWNCATAFWCSA